MNLMEKFWQLTINLLNSPIFLPPTFSAIRYNYMYAHMYIYILTVQFTGSVQT